MDLIRELLSSKKAMATLAGIVANVILHVAVKLGWGVTPEEAHSLGMKITIAIGAYVGSQAIVDTGEKTAAGHVEVAQIHADSAATNPTPPAAVQTVTVNEDKGTPKAGP